MNNNDEWYLKSKTSSVDTERSISCSRFFFEAFINNESVRVRESQRARERKQISRSEEWIINPQPQDIATPEGLNLLKYHQSLLILIIPRPLLYCPLPNNNKRWWTHFKPCMNNPACYWRDNRLKQCDTNESTSNLAGRASGNNPAVEYGVLVQAVVSFY